MPDLKVLHVYKTFQPETVGGIETMILDLAIGCRDFGLQSDVFVLSPSANPRQISVRGLNVSRARSLLEIASTPFSLSALLQFRKIVKHYDLVHFHHPFPFADLLWIFGGRNTNCVVTYHSDIVRQKFLKLFYFPFQSLFLNCVDRIICTSENYRRSSRTLSRFLSKTEVIPIGIETCVNQCFENSVVEGLEVPDCPYFLYLGALRQYKGLEVLLQAAQHCSTTIIIAGDGPKREELERLKSSLRISNVKFLGRVDEPHKALLLKSCKAIVLPSNERSEAYGVVLLEAAKFGKPMISTELETGTSFVNIDHETGFVVQPNDPIALADAINEIVSHPDLEKRMGTNARARFLNYFSRREMCQRYVDVYHQIMGDQ